MERVAIIAACVVLSASALAAHMAAAGLHVAVVEAMPEPERSRWSGCFYCYCRAVSAPLCWLGLG